MSAAGTVASRERRTLKAPALPVWARLALREMRGGLKGFSIFLACLAIGVASIAGVGSLAGAMEEGLARESRSILGGDIGVSRIQRDLEPQEMAAVEALGPVARFVTMTGMVRTPGGESAVAALKAVGPSYPLTGEVTLADGGDLHTALAGENGVPGLVVEPLLAARMGLELGDEVSVGRTTLRLAGIIETEPDRLGSGFNFGPRAMLSSEAMEAAGLIQTGSLVRFQYRALLPDGMSDAELAVIETRLEEGFPDAGWRVRTREDASDRLSEQVDRFGQFLVLVGLTALVVGGVGVANAVRAYMDTKREVVAVLKSLGAPAGTVFWTYLAQIGVMTLLGVAIGLVAGALLPTIIDAAFGDLLPARLASGVYPGALALAAAFGVLTALAFALVPLVRARRVPAQALFRNRLGAETRSWRESLRDAGPALIAGAVLVVLAVALSDERDLAAGFLGGAALVFLLLRGLAKLLMLAASRLPRPKGVARRMALTALYRPGALTPTLVLSMGLGLSLLVTLTLVDTSIRQTIDSTLPEEAPSFFFLDVQSTEADAFLDFVEAEAPTAVVETSPQLRGRVVSLGGVAQADLNPSEDAEWAVRGDRGITYSATVPEGDRIVTGEWWPEDYAGEPLVSFDEEIARGVGLEVGDEVTVNVLGREITARLANTRTIEWESLGINFVMVFSPNTFAGAPHGVLVTLTYPDGGDVETEGALLRQMGQAFPTVTAVRVKEALETVNDIVSRLAWAIRGASLVTLAVSVLVLAGALAAAHRHRIREATILKTLGATRARLLATFGLEYAVLGGVTSLFGVGLGMLAAWVVTSLVIEIEFMPSLGAAFATALIATAVTVALGLASTAAAMRHKPAQVLRDL